MPSSWSAFASPRRAQMPPLDANRSRSTRAKHAGTSFVSWFRHGGKTRIVRGRDKRGGTSGVSDSERDRAGPETGAGDGNAANKAVPDLAARLRAHTKALRRDVRALQSALADVDAAIARSRNRIEHLRKIVPARKPKSRHPEEGLDAHEEERRSDGDRRSGIDRRQLSDPLAPVSRWIEGLPMERRASDDRRCVPDRRAGSDGQAPPTAPHGEAEGQSNTVVSLAAFRARRAALRGSRQ